MRRTTGIQKCDKSHEAKLKKKQDRFTDVMPLRSLRKSQFVKTEATFQRESYSNRSQTTTNKECEKEVNDIQVIFWGVKIYAY